MQALIDTKGGMLSVSITRRSLRCRVPRLAWAALSESPSILFSETYSLFSRR